MQNLVKIKPLVDNKTPVSYANLKNKIYQRNANQSPLKFANQN